jgi:hypothetical protein
MAAPFIANTRNSTMRCTSPSQSLLIVLLCRSTVKESERMMVRAGVRLSLSLISMKKPS